MAHAAAALALATLALLLASARGSRPPGNDARLEITGGHETTIEKFPYQVALLYRSFFVCGGSILDARFILTAAHCLFEKSGRRREKGSFAVRAGSTNRQSGGQLVDVANMASDSRYSPASRAHDTAVLKLVRPLQLGVAVRPVRLVAVGKGAPRPGLTIALSGWGSLHFKQTSSPVVLHTVDVNVKRRLSARCTVAYRKLAHPTTITDEMFCAAARGRDSCAGDSGGPAVDKLQGKQVGIISFGVGCADPEYDGVYTNLASSKVRSFIDYALKAL